MEGEGRAIATDHVLTKVTREKNTIIFYYDGEDLGFIGREDRSPNDWSTCGVNRKYGFIGDRFYDIVKKLRLGTVEDGKCLTADPGQDAPDDQRAAVVGQREAVGRHVVENYALEDRGGRIPGDYPDGFTFDYTAIRDYGVRRLAKDRQSRKREVSELASTHKSR
jgi:hypothetical protein